MKERRLLILEPYGGGSHMQFLTGLQQHIEARCQVMSLPARNWKMRMQLSAPWALNCLKELPPGQRCFDTVLCSAFMDVAVFRSLLTTLPWWNPATRFCTYFHENQFAYPGQFRQDSNRQFAAINYTTALASDRIAFNSHYNRTTFLHGCCQYLRKARDMGVQATAEEIEGKSRILSPGLDFSLIDQAVEWTLPGTSTQIPCNVPVIVWNHRWEHDKNPEEFFEALSRLKEQGYDYRLIVLGQSFSCEPHCFQEARKSLAEKIQHFGYAPTRQAYIDLLQQGTIVVSTARHEFFGLAVLEAVRAGCWPLLPERLAYPEIFDKKFLYPINGFLDSLKGLLQGRSRLSPEERMNITEKYSWEAVRRDFTDWLFAE